MCSTQWLGSGWPDLTFGLVNALVKPQSNLVNLGQLWSNLVKPPWISRNVFWLCLKGFLVQLVPPGPSPLGPSCLVLSFVTRENPGGKNRILTVSKGKKSNWTGLLPLGGWLKEKISNRTGIATSRGVSKGKISKPNRFTTSRGWVKEKNIKTEQNYYL